MRSKNPKCKEIMPADPLYIPFGGDIQDLMAAIFDVSTFAAGLEGPVGFASF
jgi:hypothetical protein